MASDLAEKRGTGSASDKEIKFQHLFHGMLAGCEVDTEQLAEVFREPRITNEQLSRAVGRVLSDLDRHASQQALAGEELQSAEQDLNAAVNAFVAEQTKKLGSKQSGVDGDIRRRIVDLFAASIRPDGNDVVNRSDVTSM